VTVNEPTDAISDPVRRARLAELQQRLTDGLVQVDPHHRLAGRPVRYNIISGQAFEIVFRDVPSIDESEVLGVKRLIGEDCYCRVTPQTAETLTVRFVIPLPSG
jgi:hypothetical protein